MFLFSCIIFIRMYRKNNKKNYSFNYFNYFSTILLIFFPTDKDYMKEEKVCGNFIYNYIYL